MCIRDRLNATSYLTVDSQGRLYAASSGMSISVSTPLIGVWAPNVYRSSDNGASWSYIGQTAGGQNISSIAVDAHDDNAVYFSSSDTDPAVGVYKTPPSYEVGAAVYEFAATNDELRAYHINDVASNGAQPGTVYAATLGQGLIKSTDHGQGWSWISNGLPDWADAVAVHPTDANIAYFAACEGFGLCTVYRTDDGGNVWEPRSGGLPNAPGAIILDLAIHQGTPSTLYLAGGYGVSKTIDSGLNWMATTLVTQSNGIAMHPSTPGVVYAAADGVYETADGGTTWTALFTSTLPILDVLVNPVSPSHLYATGADGTLWKSSDGGTNWDSMSLAGTLGVVDFPQGVQSGRLGYDSRAGIIYVALGSYGLVASDDGGATWRKVSGDNVPPMAMNSVFYQAQNDALYLGGSAGLWMRGGHTMYMPQIFHDAPY